MEQISRTQLFELVTSLMIFCLGFVLAYTHYASWTLSIVAGSLFIFNLIKTTSGITRLDARKSTLEN